MIKFKYPINKVEIYRIIKVYDKNKIKSRRLKIMNQAKYEKVVTKLATVDEARERYRLGRNLLMKIAEDNNAVRRFGKSVRIDIPAMDNAINNY